jgi:hypothetical protein
MINLSARATGFTLALLLTTSPAFAESPQKSVILLPIGTQPLRATPRAPAAWAISSPQLDIGRSPEIAFISPFQNRLKIGTSKAIMKAFSADLGDVTLLIATIRSKSVRIDGLSNFAHSRFANMEAYAGIEAPLNSHDAISLTGNWALERRRPSLLISTHNQFRTTDRAISLSWTRDDRFQLSLSVFNTRPSGNRSTSERRVDLAAGSPRAARGVGLEFTSTPTHEPDKLAFGVDLRQQSGEANYTANRVLYRPETRGQLFLRATF